MTPAAASLLSGEALDTAADVVSWVVLIAVPLIVISLFWIVHVLPEKIAYKNHHPQARAIHTLCLLSLAFGGLLWPIAWLWAYTKPVAYKLAYGAERAEGYYLERGDHARSGELLQHELAALRRELETMHERGALSPALAKLRDDLIAMEAAPAEPAVPQIERRRA